MTDAPDTPDAPDAPAAGDDRLRRLTDQLERAAAELRAGELEPDDAARVVEECARLAGEAATELDRRARDGGPG